MKISPVHGKQMLYTGPLGSGENIMSRGNSIFSVVIYRAVGSGISTWKTNRFFVAAMTCGRICALDQVQRRVSRRITGCLFGRSMINANLSEQ
jgi:hypothetical protein